MKTIWEEHIPVLESNVNFCAGRDVSSVPMSDELLIMFDIWVNYAHCKMLNRQSIISDEEWVELEIHLRELMQAHKKKEFKLDPTLEDVHTNIENYITQRCKAGKKIHTGRSRNDQVTTDVRLFVRSELVNFLFSLDKLIDAILLQAEKELYTCLPGFTHYQPAMWTTFGHWLTCWVQGLVRSYKRLYSDLLELNISPLGSAAAFGSSWNIDRELTAGYLAFDGVQLNTMDCITARGEFEAKVTADLCLLSNQFAVISQDLMMLSHPYFNMLQIDEHFVTGSSIMPQKKNPDFAEVIRGKCSVIQGLLVSLLSIPKGLISGYNRDTQFTKPLLIDVFREISQVPAVLKEVIGTLKLNKQRMKKLCQENYTYTADLTDIIARKYGLGFRDSYRCVAQAVNISKGKPLKIEHLKQAVRKLGINLDIDFDLEQLLDLKEPIKIISTKDHLGGVAPKSVKQMVDIQYREIRELNKNINAFSKKIETAFVNCFYE